MKSDLFEILPSAMLIASEVFVAAGGISALFLAPLLSPQLWHLAALGLGLGMALIAGGLFSRLALRTAKQEAELAAMNALDN